MAKTTKAPTGITINREDKILTNEKTAKFTTEWKLGEKYGAGQEMYYELGTFTDPGSSTTTPNRTDVTISTTTVNKEITINFLNYYPASGKPYLKTFTPFIRGKRTKKYKWSNYSSKAYTMLIPPKPIVAQALSGDHANECVFSWELDKVEKPEQVFYDFEWQSVLAKNANYKNGSDADWSTIENDKKGTSTAGSTSGSTRITEDFSVFGNDSYTRWVRVRARGPAGASDWVYARHVYAKTHPVQNTTASAEYLEATGGYLVTCSWEAPSDYSKPIDSVSVRYIRTTPEVTYSDSSGTRHMSISRPSDEDTGWTVANTLGDTSGKDMLIFETETGIGADKLMFVQVNTEHDGETSYGRPTLVKTKNIGVLSDPEGLSVNANTSTHRVQVTATNTSSVPYSFLAVYYRDSEDANSNRIIGIIPHGQSSGTFQAPDWGTKGVSFGVQAVLGDYSPIQQSSEGVTDYKITNRLMESSYILWDGGSMPLPPTNVTLSSPSNGIIQVKWDWTWTDADSAELSWSDSKDAWDSTDEPQTYVISNMRPGQWKIAGVGTGTWYVRVRLIKTSDDGVDIFGTYSEMKEIKLSSAPDIPSLTLSPSIITEDDSTTCYWAFSSNDGSAQTQAEICEATIETNTETGVSTTTYGKAIAKTESAQSIVLKASDYGWEAGETHNLCVRVMSASGETSAGWSPPAALTIAQKVTASITSTSLVDQTIGTRSVKALTDFPLTVTVAGAGEGGTTSVVIERATDYKLVRPDDSDITGYEGETIAIMSQTGEETITINQNDILGSLDDGAAYRLIALVKDTYGQSATDQIDFEVRWTHQAHIPSAEFEHLVNEDEIVTFITPILPSAIDTGDTPTCDIYRLSADKPELIIKDGTFGTKYVDPYPTLGSFGGHRIVYKTKNGDYITSDNQQAWVDYGEEEGNTIDRFAIIIDFGKDSVILPYDISVSNQWAKDFTETRYLGGSIQGDWNLGVSRKTSLKTTTVVTEDPDTIVSMRKLAEHPGVCHIRTPEGSSFSADVQVNEDREERMVNKLAKFSISITRVDSAGFDGQTYDEWYVEEDE